MRKEIESFAIEMEKVMGKHDPVKGKSWKECELNYLVNKITEELDEVKYTYWFNKDHKTTKKELIDVANMCMMVWNRL